MRGVGERLRGLVDWASSGDDRRFFLAVFLPVAAIYLATTSWGLNVNVDVMTNTYTAWSVGTTGSPVVRDYNPPVDQQGWVSFLSPRSADGAVSPYPPGAPLLAAPLYSIASRDLNSGSLSRWGPEGLITVFTDFPDVWPGSVMAALSSATAMAFLGLTFRGISSSSALLGAYVASFGTSVWSVASDALWQHGPSLMWLSIAIYLLQSERWWGAGLAFGAAILTRQLTGVIAAVAGLSLAISHKSFGPSWRIGLAASTGLLAVSAWYLRWWDTIAPWGPRTAVASRALSVSGSQLVGDFVSEVGPFQNILLGAFEPGHGFMILSSIFLVAAPFLGRAWHDATSATRAAAAAGLAYYVVQHWIQIYAHSGYLGYRYPLEALLASGPLWFRAFLLSRIRVPRLSLFAVKLSIGIHAILAVMG